MYKHSNRLVCLAAGLALAVAACGDDPTGTNSGDQLTTLEVQALFRALGSSFDSIGVTGANAQRVSATQMIASGASAAVPIDESFNITVPCESGNIQVVGSMTGNIDEQTFASTITMEFTWSLNGCLVPTETTTFTVDGDPEINFSAELTFSETEFGMSGTETGGFSFTSSDDRTGSCAVDVTFSTSLNMSTGADTTTITGTICGLNAADVGMVGV